MSLSCLFAEQKAKDEQEEKKYQEKKAELEALIEKYRVEKDLDKKGNTTGRKRSHTAIYSRSSNEVQQLSHSLTRMFDCC